MSEKQNNVWSATYKPGKPEEKSCEVSYEFGESLQEMNEKFTENVVFSFAKKLMVIRLQAGLRKALETGKDPQEWADNWKPGAERISRGRKKTIAVEEMDLDQLKELKAKLDARARELRDQPQEAA